MTSKKILSLSALSGLIGAMFSALLFVSISNSNAAVTTSGYYVCGIKTTGALRMSPSSNKCKSTEFRYFFASTVDQVDSGTGQNTAVQNTATYKFLAPPYSYNSCGYGGSPISVVTGVTWNSYDKYNPLTVDTQYLKICEETVNVP